MPEKAEGDKSKTPEISRRASLKEDGIEDPKMPPCEAPHLISYLFEIGPTLPAGMGDGPITHGEIESWQRNTGITLHSWEARFVKRLSIEYLGESHRARDRNCPPPWEAAKAIAEELRRNPVSLKDSLRALAKL